MVPLTISVVVLIIFSGLFSATETAYSCANRIKLKSMAALGKKHADRVCKFAEEKYDKLITTILIGNNIVNLTASALATVLFSRLLVNSSLDSTTISTIVMTTAVLIFGEITPKYFAAVYPEKFAFWLYPFVQVCYWLFLPLGYVFNGYKKLLARIFRLKPNDTITDEELISLVNEAEEDGTLKEDESELVRSALEFDDLKVEDILVPRVDVVAVNINASMDEIFALFKENCYSRLPVYKDTIDNVIGLIHERDFYTAYLGGDKEIAHVVQEIAFTTEYTRISALLKQLQKQKIHMAAVSDEYGGLVGIVTLEDILEELVGEIWDEHDEEEVLYGRISEGEYWVDGKCDLETFFGLYDIGEEDENFEANTVGGWVMEKYGGIPPVGEVLRYKFLEIKVVKTTKQKVLKIRSRRADEDVGDEKAEEKRRKSDE
ncbi:MAG: hemolysin family protein [Candidatus Borkfalkiaceae bacterium]|nr:hemolysin family protein [Clostridia bacterium]MDY6222935.1 hemolysin family protein [Christensenellaceae bacterium]